MKLAVAYENEALYAEAKVLARQLNLPINNDAEAQLLLTSSKLLLKIAKFSPLAADFQWETWKKRQQAGKSQGLIRACQPKPGMRIIDATAGWGRDAAILASFGAQVLMLERQPVMAALLDDALKRRDEMAKTKLNLRLCQMDAIEFLNQLKPQDFPEVIYIDPMHPERQKSALVKKDMQILQQLIGSDRDALKLIEIACKRVLKRVVVKWPQHLAALLTPSATVSGKTVRFDIYSVLGRGV